MCLKFCKWILFLVILGGSLKQSVSALWESLSQEQKQQVESTEIIKILKEIIEKNDKIISTEIGIVSMLNPKNEHLMNGILQKLQSSIETPIPWTVIQDSKDIQLDVLLLLLYKTMFIYFIEKVSLLISSI